MDFDFSLTKEQMIEFVKRYFDEFDEKKEFEVVVCEYPVMAIDIMRDKKPYIRYSIIFADDTVYFIHPHSSWANGITTPYVSYMYELFGEDYLKYIEAAKREQIESEKAATNDRPKEEKNLDNELADYISFLNSIRNNALNP